MYVVVSVDHLDAHTPTFGISPDRVLEHKVSGRLSDFHQDLADMTDNVPVTQILNYDHDKTTVLACTNVLSLAGSVVHMNSPTVEPL